MFQPLSSFGMGPKFRRLSKHPCLSSLWHLVTNFELRLSDRHDQMIKPTAMARQPFSFQPADEEPFVYTCAFAALFADVDPVMLSARQRCFNDEIQPRHHGCMNPFNGTGEGIRTNRYSALAPIGLNFQNNKLRTIIRSLTDAARSHPGLAARRW